MTDFRPSYRQNLDGYDLCDGIDCVLQRDSGLLHATRCPSIQVRLHQCHEQLAVTDAVPTAVVADLFAAGRANPTRVRQIGWCGVKGAGSARPPSGR